MKTSPVASRAKQAGLISGISCAGHACVAVGSYYDSTNSQNTLIERWNGSAWQQQPSPESVRDSTLAAVSCVTSSRCVAVGSPVLVWRGSDWQVSANSSPLTSVSCTTVRFCLAVGMTDDSHPVYGTWQGGAWQVARLPAPRQSPAEQVTVADVSCVTAEFCLAVGNYATGISAQPSPQYRDRTLAEEWNGRTWRLLPTPNVGKIDLLGAVSCSSGSNCTAVGAFAGQYPLAERWNGTSWRVQHLPLPGRVGYTRLSAVSCGSAADCTAVGDYQGLPVAEVSLGSRWHVEWLPQPSGDNHAAQLLGVSCVSPAACMAVGHSGDATIYAERWTGGRWQLVGSPDPA